MKKTITTKKLSNILIEERNKYERLKDELIKSETDITKRLLYKNNWYIRREVINELLTQIKNYEHGLLH